MTLTLRFRIANDAVLIDLWELIWKDRRDGSVDNFFIEEINIR